MIDLIDIAIKVQRRFEEWNWRFCFIGGLAVQQWGEPRLTRDVDLSLFTGVGEEERFVLKLLEDFESRVDNCLDFALRNRVVLLTTGGNVGIDIALACLPFEDEMITRAQSIQMLPGKSLKLCTAEDLIVLKAFAARPVDWHDVQTVVTRQSRDNLDWEYISRQLEPLAEAKEDPDILQQLQRIRDL